MSSRLFAGRTKRVVEIKPTCILYSEESESKKAITIIIAGYELMIPKAWHF